MHALAGQIERHARVGIVGPSGVGKTQLACAYIKDNYDLYSFRWWIRSGQPEVLAADYDAIAVALGLGSDPAHARIKVSRWLDSNDGWLLVFDDVSDGVGISEFLPAGPRGHVIVTSRDAHRIPVQSIRLDDWSVSDSIAFLDSQGDASRDVLHDIAERLYNVPLAIDQAASYMRETGIDATAYLRMLKESMPDMLEAGRAFSRDESLVATYELAIEFSERTAKGARELLNLCSFYAGSEIPREVPRLLKRGREASGSPPTLGPYRLSWRMRNELTYNSVVAALARQSLVTTTDANLYVHGLVQQAVRSRLSPRQVQSWTYWAVSSLLLELERAREADRAEFRRIAKMLLPHVLAGAERARENVPKARLFRYNWPTWMAWRDSARALTCIAQGIFHEDDLPEGFRVSLQALDMAVESFPWCLSFQGADPIPSLCALADAAEAVAAYSRVTGQWSEGERLLGKALELFGANSSERRQRYNRKYAPHFCARVRVTSAAAVVFAECGQRQEAKGLLSEILRDFQSYVEKDPVCRDLIVKTLKELQTVQ